MVKYSRGQQEQMRLNLEQWRLSGMTIVNYCQTHSLKEHVFQYWKQKYSSPKINKGSFVPMSLPTGHDVNSIDTEVLLPSGIRIRFSNMLPVDYLKALCCI